MNQEATAIFRNINHFVLVDCHTDELATCHEPLQLQILGVKGGDRYSQDDLDSYAHDFRHAVMKVCLIDTTTLAPFSNARTVFVLAMEEFENFCFVAAHIALFLPCVSRILPVPIPFTWQ